MVRKQLLTVAAAAATTGVSVLAASAQQQVELIDCAITGNLPATNFQEQGTLINAGKQPAATCVAASIVVTYAAAKAGMSAVIVSCPATGLPVVNPKDGKPVVGPDGKPMMHACVSEKNPASGKHMFMGDGTPAGAANVTEAMYGKIPTDEAIATALGGLCMNEGQELTRFWDALADTNNVGAMNALIGSQKATVQGLCVAMAQQQAAAASGEQKKEAVAPEVKACTITGNLPPTFKEQGTLINAGMQPVPVCTAASIVVTYAASKAGMAAAIATCPAVTFPVVDPKTGKPVAGADGKPVMHSCVSEKNPATGKHMFMGDGPTAPADVTAAMYGKVPTDEAIGSAVAALCMNDQQGLNAFWGALADSKNVGAMNALIASQKATVQGLCAEVAKMMGGAAGGKKEVKKIEKLLCSVTKQKLKEHKLDDKFKVVEKGKYGQVVPKTKADLNADQAKKSAAAGGKMTEADMLKMAQGMSQAQLAKMLQNATPEEKAMAQKLMDAKLKALPQAQQDKMKKQIKAAEEAIKKRPKGAAAPQKMDKSKYMSDQEFMQKMKDNKKVFEANCLDQAKFAKLSERDQDRCTAAMSRAKKIKRKMKIPAKVAMKMDVSKLYTGDIKSKADLVKSESFVAAQQSAISSALNLEPDNISINSVSRRRARMLAMLKGVNAKAFRAAERAVRKLAAEDLNIDYTVTTESECEGEDASTCEEDLAGSMAADALANPSDAMTEMLKASLEEAVAADPTLSAAVTVEEITGTEVTGDISADLEEELECIPGEFKMADECYDCPLGTFSEESDQDTCLACAGGVSTVGTGSSTEADCLYVEETQAPTNSTNSTDTTTSAAAGVQVSMFKVLMTGVVVAFGLSLF